MYIHLSGENKNKAKKTQNQQNKKNKECKTKPQTNNF